MIMAIRFRRRVQPKPEKESTKVVRGKKEPALSAQEEFFSSLKGDNLKAFQEMLRAQSTKGN